MSLVGGGAAVRKDVEKVEIDLRKKCLMVFGSAFYFNNNTMQQL